MGGREFRHTYARILSFTSTGFRFMLPPHRRMRQEIFSCMIPKLLTAYHMNHHMSMWWEHLNPDVLMVARESAGEHGYLFWQISNGR
jgi:hypothetical protein